MINKLMLRSALAAIAKLAMVVAGFWLMMIAISWHPLTFGVGFVVSIMWFEVHYSMRRTIARVLWDDVQEQARQIVDPGLDDSV